MASFLRPASAALLAAVLPLAGCGLLGGADKAKDAESIGYACRVSSKLPEDCMKENETYSPTSLLDGWKSADKDIKDRKLDPLLGKGTPAPEMKADAAKPEAGPKPDAEAKPEAKPDADKAAAEQKPAADDTAAH